MKLKHLLTACLTGLLLATGGHANDLYPNRPVSLVVPYPPGGSSDVIARVLHAPLGRVLGQPVIVENLAGAAGAIGAQKVLNTAAEGYSVFQGSVTETILVPLTNAAIKYKSEDFRLVRMIGVAPMVLVVRADLPASSMDELVALARSQATAGKPLTFGSTGYGSLFHVLGEQLSATVKAPLVHVPYKGGAPLMQDLGSGQLDFMLAPIQQQLIGMADAGRLKILGTLEPAGTRDAPLLSRYGSVNDGNSIKDFSFRFWHAYFVRKDTPEAVVARLGQALDEVLADPAVRTQLAAQGIAASGPLSARDTAQAYRTEIQRYQQIARAARLQPQ